MLQPIWFGRVALWTSACPRLGAYLILGAMGPVVVVKAHHPGVGVVLWIAAAHRPRFGALPSGTFFALYVYV